MSLHELLHVVVPGLQVGDQLILREIRHLKHLFRRHGSVIAARVHCIQLIGGSLLPGMFCRLVRAVHPGHLRIEAKGLIGCHGIHAGFQLLVHRHIEVMGVDDPAITGQVTHHAVVQYFFVTRPQDLHAVDHPR